MEQIAKHHSIARWITREHVCKRPCTGLVDNKASCLTGAGGHSLHIHGDEERKISAWERGLRQEHRSLGRAAAARKWGEERQRCLQGAVFVWWLIEKEEGDLSHIHVSFRQHLKSFRLAAEKILSPTNPNIPAEDTYIAELKWPGNRWEENARYKHLCYQWSGPRTRRWWRKKLPKASPAFWVTLWFAFWNIFLICHQGFIEPRIEPYSEHCLSILQVIPAHPKLNFMLG